MYGLPSDFDPRLFVGHRLEKASLITDQDEAQRFDLSFRILRFTLLIVGIHWLFIAALLNVTTRVYWRQGWP
jgi:hypothetical protein